MLERLLRHGLSFRRAADARKRIRRTAPLSLEAIEQRVLMAFTASVSSQLILKSAFDPDTILKSKQNPGSLDETRTVQGETATSSTTVSAVAGTTSLVLHAKAKTIVDGPGFVFPYVSGGATVEVTGSFRLTEPSVVVIHGNANVQTLNSSTGVIGSVDTFQIFSTYTEAGGTAIDQKLTLGRGNYNYDFTIFASDKAFLATPPRTSLAELNLSITTAPASPTLPDIEMLPATSRDGVIKYKYKVSGNTGPVQIGVYASDRPTLDASASLLFSKTVTPTPNATNTGAIPFANIPFTLKPYLFVAADAAKTFYDPVDTGSILESNEGNNTSIARLVTLNELRTIMPRLLEKDAKRYIDPLNRAMAEFQINTSQRISSFLSQLGHESSDLTDWTENPTVTKPLGARVKLNGIEWTVTSSTVTSYTLTHRTASGLSQSKTVQVTGPNFERYDNQQGNGPNEGRFFFGRGPIQITFKDTYKKFSDYLHSVGDYPEKDFTAPGNRELLADSALHPEIGLRAAGWFWSIYKQSISVSRWGTSLNGIADSVNSTDDSAIPEIPARRAGQKSEDYIREINDLLAPYNNVEGINAKITLVVNGGTNGLSERLRRYKLALRVLGLRP